jgi:hypothetical protein
MNSSVLEAVSNESQFDSFETRTTKYLSLAAQTGETWFNQAGEWISLLHPLASRERMWLCFTFYRCGRSHLADAVLRQTPIQCHQTSRGVVHFDIFESNIAVTLLSQHSQDMAPDVMEKLEAVASEGIAADFPGNRAPDYQFHGYNDNMPAKATMGLILGGERLQNAEAFEHGLWNLRDFKAQLTRRGINSEFNSPTYSPLTLHALAEIVSHAQCEEARNIALWLESRLWEDFAARFHPETGIVAGPYSRAYTCDTLGHVTVLSSLLWFVLGNIAKPSPLLLFDLETKGNGLILHHRQDVPFNIAQMCWIAAGNYHLSETCRAFFQNKSYPFEVRASSEQGNMDVDFPARECYTVTRLESDWTLGTSSTPFCSGEQTQSYFTTYRRNVPVESFRDMGTIYAKIAVNDEAPGLTPYSDAAEVDMVSSRAHSFAMQHEGAALVLTQPHRSLAERNDLTRLSELLVFPSHFGGVDDVLVNGQRHIHWEGEVKGGSWLVMRRGRLLLGVRSLSYTPEGKAKLTLEKEGNYEWLRATFYEGQTRQFERQELDDLRGGFIIEHASIHDYSSLESFALSLQIGSVSDFHWGTRRVTYQRAVGDGATLEVSLSAAAVTPRFATVNGALTPILRRSYGTFKPSVDAAPERISRPWKSLEVWNYAPKGQIGD